MDGGPGGEFHFTAYFCDRRDGAIYAVLNPRPVDLAGSKVLMVDDSATSRRILELKLND